MKRLLIFSLLTTLSLPLTAQEEAPKKLNTLERIESPDPPRAEPVPPEAKQEEPVKPAKQIELTSADSDGDLIPDNEDSNPLVPNAPLFSWWISDVTVGWDLDQSQIDKVEEVTGEDTTKQRKTSFTIGGGFGGGGGASYGLNSDPKSIFLSLLPGGSLLKAAGDDFKAQSHLAASFDLKAGLDKSKVVKEIRTEFQKLEKQRAIKNRHIEFTVEFFNQTNDNFKFTDFSIPVQTASRQTRAEALYYVAGKTSQNFEVPANRPTGYPVRFRADLSTTQSEQILDALEAGELNIAIDRANGRAINQTNQKDEIAQRQRITNFVEKSTAELRFLTDNNSTSWRVAKTNPTTGKPTTIEEAIEAINQMATSANDQNYIEASGGVVYAVGSFRNTCRNAFEVTNAKNTALKITGWTRMNRYGQARNGKWEHLLESPLGEEGATYSLLPYEITREELKSHINLHDPKAKSEWLSLCDFWLNYDATKDFSEYPLRNTTYPLAEFYEALSSDFASANFEIMVSNWINDKRDNDSDSPETIDNSGFREKVRHYRKEILDSAFEGYTESGALLTRIAASDRDAMETRAIETALQMGNTDAAAVETMTKLFHDLNRGEKIDLFKFKEPDHIFAKNLKGFLHFAASNRGLNPGKNSAAATQAFTYSVDRGNPFAQAMQGWLSLNTARYKTSKLINRPNWPQDRDLGLDLLEKSVDNSTIAKYVLGKNLYQNNIAIEKDQGLARKYLALAAEAKFGDAEAVYADWFGE